MAYSLFYFLINVSNDMPLPYYFLLLTLYSILRKEKNELRYFIGVRFFHLWWR